MPKCISCNVSKGPEWYKSLKNHRTKKLTKKCLTCRKSCVNSRRKMWKSKNTKDKTVACKNHWTKWCKENSCVDCGITDYRIMTADHRLGVNKVYSLSSYTWWSSHGGIPAMDKEFKKVVPRCVTCHRIKTQEDNDVHNLRSTSRDKHVIRRRQIRRDLLEYVNSVKMNIGECYHCKRRVTPLSCTAFDFDHVDPSKKVKPISGMLRGSYHSIKKIDKEIAKCSLLCGACHHLKTHYDLKVGYISKIKPSKMQEQQQDQQPELLHDRFFSLKDQNITEPEQRSPEWFERRRNKLTGSKLSQFLFIKTQDDRVKLYEEVFEGRKRSPFTDEQQKWVKWGCDHEDHALKVLLDNAPNMYAMEAPMVQHSSCTWVASSPDGFYELVDDIGNVYEKGCIEIKCPGKKKKANTKPTYYYVLQMYLEMACSGNDKVIFCSWGPDACRAWKLEWNNELWELLSTMMDDLKNTKSSRALPFDKWSMLQYRLKSACHSACNEATPLFEGDGWDPQFNN